MREIWREQRTAGACGEIWDRGLTGLGGRAQFGMAAGGGDPLDLGFGARVSLYTWARPKNACEIDASWAREFDVSGALALGGAHLLLASDRVMLYIYSASDDSTLNVNIYSVG